MLLPLAGTLSIVASSLRHALARIESLYEKFGGWRNVRLHHVSRLLERASSPLRGRMTRRNTRIIIRLIRSRGPRFHSGWA